MINHDAEPWHREPDEFEWVDPATGYECLILRNDLLYNLNGYVYVPTEHVLHGAHESDKLPQAIAGISQDVMQQKIGKRSAVDLFTFAATREMTVGLLFNVHGSITFSGRLRKDKRPRDRWAFGFDCAHVGDLSPMLRKLMKFMPDSESHEVYRTFDYVKAEVESLAKQLSAIDEYAKLVSVEGKQTGGEDGSGNVRT